MWIKILSQDDKLDATEKISFLQDIVRINQNEAIDWKKIFADYIFNKNMDPKFIMCIMNSQNFN